MLVVDAGGDVVTVVDVVGTVTPVAGVLDGTTVVEDDDVRELPIVVLVVVVTFDEERGAPVAVAGLVPSGEVQLTGGTPEPVWPGMSTVPAHPKLENVAASVTFPPSPKSSVAFT